MEIAGFVVPLLLVVVCGLVLFAVFGWGVVLVLVQLGVIVRESRRPPHLDHGDYRLDQGREAGVVQRTESSGDQDRG